METKQIELHDMKICGEIATLISVDKREFYFNCKFCDHTYLQLQNFQNHIYEMHLNDLALSLKEELHCDENNEDSTVIMNNVPNRGSTTLLVPGSSLNEDQLIDLVKLYKKHKCLWDESEITYRFTNRRREALENMVMELERTSGKKLTRNELEKEISLLRKSCSKQKRQRISCRRNNTAFQPIHNFLTFLEADVAPYECSFCGELISAWTRYKQHLAAHDGSMPFKCHVCDHGFKLSNNLTTHLRKHVKDFTYSCGVCNKAFSSSSPLKTHMRTHTGEKPFVCHICGKLFSCRSGYLLHMQVHENKPRHKCHICSKPYFEMQRLKDHINAHLQLRNFKCDLCEKSFTSGKLMRQHKQIHDLNKKYVCQICGKRFAQAAGIISHKKSHGITTEKVIAQHSAILDIIH